ncbi:MAG: lipocalin family protein [Gammaproteobacteria bacterium]|nr:lipocalin family protein [Gammaproteobacteria bacterium]
MIRNRIATTAFLLLVLTGCTGVPEGITPVSGFEPERYLGTWYEIARLDHSFERGLSSVTAEYSAREDGGIDVVNRGLDADTGEWKTAEGRAYFVDGRDRGHLKVSFFGPFYGAYVVFELDADYRHALVAGPSRDYLWLLARTPEPDPAVVERLLARAAEAGFDVDALIRVDHQVSGEPES